MTITQDSLVIMAAALVMNRGIGINNSLPWKIPDEWNYFQSVTTKHYGEVKSRDEQSTWNNIVITGRRSYESVEMKGQPLPDRYNIVVTRNKDYSVNHPMAVAVGGLREAIVTAKKMMRVDSRIFILGGAEIYTEALQLPDCTHVLLTNIYSPTLITCDTFMPVIDSTTYRLASHTELKEFVKDMNIPQGRQQHNDLEYEFVLYIRIKVE